MSLPRFIERAVDAAVPALGNLDRSLVRRRLEGTRVNLSADPELGEEFEDGYLLAANLLSRLYPAVALTGPEALVAKGAALMRAINPAVEFSYVPFDDGFSLEFQPQTVSDSGSDLHAPPVRVASSGWDVYIDRAPDHSAPPAPPAALASAALGASALFRQVFADELGQRGRVGPEPGQVNMITLTAGSAPAIPLPDRDLGRFRLVGAGAIGQAAMLALNACGLGGEVLVYDPETIDLSNLQRYVLTDDGDVGAVKVELLAQRSANGSKLKVDGTPAEWSSNWAGEQLPTLVALDTADDRLAVQASLPGPIYNAWTQPADIGWSRHESFGEDPCLACLYWPTGPTPHRHEQVAEAFGIHPLRSLSYLVTQLPVGAPLPPGAIPAVPDTPAPAEAEQWLQRSLLDDIAEAAGVGMQELNGWQARPLADLYQDGICGGALLSLQRGDVAEDVAVPLAHQSALAGIFLATQFLAATDPTLTEHRPAAIEARIDVLSGLPEHLTRPRAQSDGCWCSDPDFLAVAAAKVHAHG